MVGYWPLAFFASLWTSTPYRSINMQKKQNLTNIQPSWPHTWSITHIYHLLNIANDRGQIMVKLKTWPFFFFFRQRTLMVSLKLILLTSRNCIIDVCSVKRCDACITNPEIVNFKLRLTARILMSEISRANRPQYVVLFYPLQ